MNHKKYMELVHELNCHNIAYHVYNDPKINDHEFDMKMRELRLYEKTHPDKIHFDTPTNKVGGLPTTSFTPVKHLERMLSLSNVFSIEELRKFTNKVKGGIFHSFKVDGLALEAVYKGGLLYQASTRGDGVTGEDVTELARLVKGIPLKLEGLLSGKDCVIRGEGYLPKNALARVNDLRKKNKEKPFDNCRNAAAGSFRLKDPKQFYQRSIYFLAYFLKSTDNLFSSMQQMYDTLESAGFQTPRTNVAQTSLDLEGIVQYCQSSRPTLPFEIDGVVFMVDSLLEQDEFGLGTNSPKYGVAYKFPAEQAKSRINSIIVQVGRTGMITPVALIEPVYVGGVIVSRVNLHNQDEIDRLGIHLGDPVLIQRAGDVVPEIKEVLKDYRDELVDPLPFKITLKCPSCQSPLDNKEDSVEKTVNLYCFNSNCKEKIIQSIDYAFSREVLNVKGISDKSIRKLVDYIEQKEQLLIKNWIELVQYILATPNILHLSGVCSEDRIPEFLSELDKRSGWTKDKIYQSLGLDGIGKVTSRNINNEVDLFKEGIDFTSVVDGLYSKGIIDITALESLRSWFIDDTYGYWPTKNALSHINALGIRVDNTILGPLTGLEFCFTGAFSVLKQALKDKVLLSGGKVSDNVSKSTDFLVSNETGTSKYQKAVKLGIKTISEQEFESLISRNKLP